MINEFRVNRPRNRRINLARVIDTAQLLVLLSVPLFFNSFKLYNKYQLHKLLWEQEKLLQEIQKKYKNEVQKNQLDMVPKVASTKNNNQKVVELDLLGRTSKTPCLRKRVQGKKQQGNNQFPKI